MRLFFIYFNPFSALSAQKNFLINIFLLVFINVLVKPLYALGVDINIQLELGNARFGQIFALWSLAYLASSVADLGISQHNSSAVSKNNDYFRQQAGNILKLKLILALIYSLLLMSLGWILGYEGLQLQMLACIGFNLICGGFIQWGRTNIAGLGYYKIDSCLSAMDKLLMLFTGWSLLKGYWGVEVGEISFILSQTIAFLLTLGLVAGINFYLFYQNKILATAKFEPLRLLKQTLPYALVVLLMGLYARLDAILLERWALDKAEAGYYSFAFRLLDLVNMVGVLCGSLLLNLFSRYLQDLKNLRRLFWLAFTFLLSAYASALVFVLIFGEWLSHFLLGYYDQKSIFILSLLFTALIFKGIIHIAGTLLTATGDLGRMHRLFIGAIAVNFCLNYFLIPLYGAKGTACVAIITQSGVAMVELYWAWRWLYKREIL